MPMTETDYSKELMENSKVAKEAAKSAREAAQAAEEAMEYARRLKEEAAEIPPDNLEAKEMAEAAAKEAELQAAAAKAAAEMTQGFWQEMVEAYTQEARRKSAMDAAKIQAQAAAQAAREAKGSTQAKILQNRQMLLASKLETLRQNAGQAQGNAKSLDEKAADAAALAETTKAFLANSGEQQRHILEEMKQLAQDLKAKEVALTETQGAVEIAQERYDEVSLKYSGYYKELEEAVSESKQLEETAKEKEALLAKVRQEAEEARHLADAAYQKMKEIETAGGEPAKETVEVKSRLEDALNCHQTNTAAHEEMVLRLQTAEAKLLDLQQQIKEAKENLPEIEEEAANLAAQFATASLAAWEADNDIAKTQGEIEEIQEHIADIQERMRIASQRQEQQAAGDPDSSPGQEELTTTDSTTSGMAVAAKAPKKGEVREKKESHRSRGKTALGYLLCIIIAIALALLVRTYFFQVTQIIGTSMVPTLSSYERVITNKTAYWNQSPQVGDIVILEDPANLGEPAYVKRVVAVGGDTIKIDNGKVFVNGVAIEEPYLAEGCITNGLVDTVVPENTIFVLGDNRPESKDSRDNSISFIPLEKVEGKVVWAIYPFDRWGSIY